MQLSTHYQPSNWDRTSLLRVVILVFLINATFCHNGAKADNFISGTVTDGDGNPLGGALVFLWKDKALVAKTETQASGYFELDIDDVRGYTIYVLADSENSPGVDYLPYVHLFNDSSLGELEINLTPAVSIVFKGDLQYIKSERTPITIDFIVSTLNKTDLQDYEMDELVYGNSEKSLNSFVELDPSHLVVPANTVFDLAINFSIFMGPQIEYISFNPNLSESLPLNTGELISLDIDQYTMPFNLGVVNSELSEVEALMDEMEEYGFYLVSERRSVESSKNFIQSALDLMDKQIYEESFTVAKRAFIDIDQTHVYLISIYQDTNASISMIIVLIAFTSTIIGFLSSNEERRKLIATISSYFVLLVVLYKTYPGSMIITIESFTKTAALSLISILILSRALPRLFNKRSRNYVSVRNIVIPIFSIAKRNIVRRRIRFGLMFTAMTILVTSFVVLTSFYQGYGLITTKLSGEASPIRGVLMRAQGYTQKDPIFLSEEFDMNWLRNQEESLSITLKAENIPFAFSVTSLNRQPILGIIGIDTKAETALVDLKDLLVEGELPNEGVAISERLKEKLGVELGDNLLLEDESVILEGVLSDATLFELNDIDGSTYLPSKEVNINPDVDPPLYETMPCEPDEVVLMHISRALENPMVKISRAIVEVRDDVDVNEFAVRLTIEKGLPAWATSEQGIIHTRLGTYIESKGQSLTVLFIIVILNIITTMLNSLYERRQEIYILSSVGLNPAHVTAIFFVEAGIMGLTAGGIGYIAGIAFYKVLLLIGVALDVRQKISVYWSVASLAIALASIFIGTFFSISYSVIITPSLMNRWRMRETRRSVTDPWEIPIPIKILSAEVKVFTNFVESALRALENNPVRVTSSIRVAEDTTSRTTRIHFIYKTVRSTLDNLYTRNELIVEEDTEKQLIKVTLISYGDQKNAYKTGSLIRRIAMRWSTNKD